MVVMETLFDLLSATGGAIFGAIFAFFLNRRRNRSLSNQLIISRQALDKIKLENDKLLTAIHEKENMILQMQMQILGEKPDANKKKIRKK